MLFSRAPIPWSASAAGDPVSPGWRHIGVYAYTCDFLKTYTNLPPCELEQAERLEQLRALYHGFPIHMDQAVEETGLEINTPEDLELAQSHFGKKFAY